jgi:GNAT superfamily N-acetyltransferase
MTPGTGGAAGTQEPGAQAPGSGHSTAREELAALLGRVSGGVFPEADGSLTVLPQPSPRDAGVIALTAHVVVFADVDPVWVAERLPAGDLSAPLNPPFLSALSRHLGRRVNSIDMLCVAEPLPGPPPLALTAARDCDHPRVARARRHRDGVHVWAAAGGGLIVLGRGVAGRREVAVEVPPDRRGQGLGRRLAAAARHLNGDEPLWAQVAPGNAASVRAFIAAGYLPVGAEALLVAGAGS